MNNINSTHGQVEISLVETAIKNLNDARRRTGELKRKSKFNQLKQPYRCGFLWLKTCIRWDEEVEELLKMMENEHYCYRSPYCYDADWLNFLEPHPTADKLASLVALVKQTGGSFINVDISDAKLINDWQKPGDLA